LKAASGHFLFFTHASPVAPIFAVEPQRSQPEQDKSPNVEEAPLPGVFFAIPAISFTFVGFTSSFWLIAFASELSGALAINRVIKESRHLGSQIAYFMLLL
jgi:hypothetical protein